MRINPLGSRLLALALLAGAILLLFALVANPLIAEYQANEAAIEQAYRMETRYRTIAASRPALARRLRRLEGDLKVSGLSFSGASDALTGAKMQSVVKKLIGDIGGRLNSTQILATVEEAGFRRIAIRVQMTSDIAALQVVLHKLEAMTPYLFIDNVVVRKNATRRRQVRRLSRRRNVTPQPRPRADGQLRIRFDVLGYAKPGDA